MGRYITKGLILTLGFKLFNYNYNYVLKWIYTDISDFFSQFQLKYIRHLFIYYWLLLIFFIANVTLLIKRHVHRKCKEILVNCLSKRIALKLFYKKFLY